MPISRTLVALLMCPPLTKRRLTLFSFATKLEGIIPALEPSHALSHVGKIAPDLPSDHLLVMNMCGRGDKDVFSVAEHLNVDIG